MTKVPDGMRVWYRHHRRQQFYRKKFVGQSLSTYIIAPRGGKTEALLYRSEDDPKTDPPIATGTAECSVHDNYNKRIGRDIALGRAIKKLRAQARLDIESTRHD